jgi:hypothetical protein
MLMKKHLPIPGFVGTVTVVTGKAGFYFNPLYPNDPGNF